MKILFLVKTNQEYGQQCQPSRSGLRNSAKFVVDAINKFDDVVAELDFCTGSGEVQSKIDLHLPDIVIIEAVWILPLSFQAIVGNNPTVKFITRIHSKIPFVAMEGTVIEWIKEYQKVSIVSFNHAQTSKELNKIGLRNIYLPNIYPPIEYIPVCNEKKKYLYKIGCFGSIRPLKNQLNQAVAAMLFADARNSAVHFYINSTRIEQRGETVLRNLRALFDGTRHKLIESGWLEHSEFLKLIGQMDACMQVSFTETFNIVAADAVFQHVPIVASEEIEWLSSTKADPNNANDMAKQIAYVIDHKQESTEDNIADLRLYNHHAIMKWFKFLKRD